MDIMKYLYNCGLMKLPKDAAIAKMKNAQIDNHTIHQLIEDKKVVTSKSGKITIKLS